MGRKSKSKNKLTLAYYELEEEGKIIDLRRFAYDYLVYSTQKFGLPAMCIKACEFEENDYPHSDFITVISRMTFRLQITHRNFWYLEFKKQYESTQLDSFEKVKKALISTFNLIQGEKRSALDVPLTRRLIYLSTISDFILFLYTANCESLYFGELPEYWTQYAKADTKLFVKHGGLSETYQRFNTTESHSTDVFFNKFIPKYCIPYNESSTLAVTYFNEEQDFFKKALSVIEEASSFVRSVRMDSLTKMKKPSKRVRTSETSLPINPGLGIRPHEEWLQMATSKQDIDDETYPQSMASTSQESVRCRRPSNRKENLKRTPSLRESEKKADLLGTTSASVRQNPPRKSYPETLRDYKESFSRDSQRTSSLLSSEDIQRVTSSFVSNAPEPFLPSASSQETSGGRKKSSTQKKEKRKSCPTSVHEQMDITGATSAVSPNILSGTSRPEMARVSDSTLEEELKRLNLGSSKRKTSDKKGK